MNTIRRTVAAAVTACAVMALSAVPAMAFDGRVGDSVATSAGEQVNEDLYFAGRTVTSNATVNGDAFIAGQTVTIGGSVSDGVTAAGQTIVVNADIGHGLRIAGSTVDIQGDVGRDVMAAGATITVHEGTSIQGDLLLGAGTAFIRGDVAGNLLGAAEDLTIEGSISGNVNVQTGTLTITPGARINGNLNYTAQSEATIPAGTVTGTVTFTQRVEKEGKDAAGRVGLFGPLAIFAGLTWKVLSYLMAFLTGILLIVLAPRRMAGAVSAIRTDTGPVAGYGAIALFVTPVAALVVCLTVIGLPLGVIAFLLWGILLYLSQMPVSLFIGHLILGRDRPLETKGFMIGCLALGLLILWLLKAIPVAGFFVFLATALFGLGAFIAGERTRMRL